MPGTNETSPKKKLIKRLRSKYRLLLIRDTTFEETFSLRLTPLNVIVVFTASFLVLGAFYVSLILFTPLKEYIPGYADGAVKTSIIRASMKTDSLQAELEALNNYQNNLKLILQGKVPVDSLSRLQNGNKDYKDLTFSVSEEDSLLRLRVEEEEQYSLNNSLAEKRTSDENYFFPPVRGVITSHFNTGIGHYGTDIVAPAGEPVKAALEGTVILSSWTSDGGYIIQIQHTNNLGLMLVSIYKHNSVLLKNSGDKVATGEPVAIIGNTGELSSGPHLHLELWKNGRPVDPEKLIVFK
ncbi:MAG: M23 family metallopeptidase [Bacteroidota bacterium]